MKVIVVTACDAVHFGLADDLFASLRACAAGPLALGFVHIGPAGRPRPVLPADVLQAEAEGAGAEGPVLGYRVAYLNVKGSLPNLFPRFDVYIWIDADCWVQTADWFDALVAGAEKADLCAHPEYDVHYVGHPTPNDRTVEIYRNLFGDAAAQATWRFAMVNAGVFAARATSPLWAKWSGSLKALRRRQAEDPARTLFFSDQIPLHHLIFSKQLSLHPLRAIHNWQAYACTPHFDTAHGRLTVPTPPFEEIGILHLAADIKTRLFRIGPLSINATLRYRDLRPFLKLGGGHSAPVRTIGRSATSLSRTSGKMEI